MIHASGNTGFTYLQRGHANVVITKTPVPEELSLNLIYINNISSPFFNWKISLVCYSLLLMFNYSVKLTEKSSHYDFGYNSNYSLV